MLDGAKLNTRKQRKSFSEKENEGKLMIIIINLYYQTKKSWKGKLIIKMWHKTIINVYQQF